MEYVGLARKYRPLTFSEIIGQPILVKTLTNAIILGKFPQAIILTGIRGVGKTTTARVIARSLNCVEINNEGSETYHPCGICVNCIAISDDRHQDVIEIDAASNTGVSDIREIIDTARYKPITARYKIYIVDEVHMLSSSAFNALLKILEEPPLYVKFILATTEIRKIPITILSRCQRFDLKRINDRELADHYNYIIQKEGYCAEYEALLIIANAAQGSVRDGLSILDQVLALGSGKVLEAEVRQLLGLASFLDILQLFDHLVKGLSAELLLCLETLYKDGANPSLIIQDLLNIIYNITIIKMINKSNTIRYTKAELDRYEVYIDKLSLTFLARCWQMLIKGLDELKNIHATFANLEMILIRIIHLSNTPLFEELKNFQVNISQVDNKKKIN